MAAPARHADETYASFGARDWAMLTGVAVTWGGSFLLIDIGLDHFAPTLVAFGRIAFGALTLAAIPAARAPVPRSDWGQIALVGLTWMAIPFVLFAVAQQWIDSSLAGMINAATPLFVALVAGLFVRRAGCCSDSPGWWGSACRRSGRARTRSASGWFCWPRCCTASRSTWRRRCSAAAGRCR
jgi:hypothetical protein